MSTTAKHMLLSAISQHGNYQEKQLAKSGELGACAADIIKRLRRNVSLYHWLIVAFPACLVIRQIVACFFFARSADLVVFLSLEWLDPADADSKPHHSARLTFQVRNYRCHVAVHK